MKEKVYVRASNILTGLGETIEENATKMLTGETAVRKVEDIHYSTELFFASRVPFNEKEYTDNDFTRFEAFLIHSVGKALLQFDPDLGNSRTILIISSTKGNIDQLEQGKRIRLTDAASWIATFHKAAHRPLVISNACISGGVALLTAKRLIESGVFDHAVVTGADILSRFVVSGFQSFKALASGPCRPFDAGRDGLSLGEGAGTIILSKSAPEGERIVLTGGGISNDANHISGPSRNGEGLFLAVRSALQEAGTSLIPDYISGHGTATLYNDEMESKALNLAGLSHIPLNSFKGFLGHTLGAAGIIEAALGLWSMQNKCLIPSFGYSEHGVSQPLNIIQYKDHRTISSFLKTASGFGGCNSALIFEKV